VVVLSLLVGGSALLLWLTQSDPTRPAGQGRDSLYLFAGVAELAWALRVADANIERPPIPWTAWGTLEAVALAVWLSSMAVFCMKLAGWEKGRHGPKLLWALLLLVVAGCVAGFASFQFDQTWFLTAWILGTSVFFSAFCTVFIVSAWRSANTLHRLVALALAVNVVTGLRDALVFRLADSYGDNTYLRYTSVLFGLVLGYVLLTRFHAATSQARELMRHLEETVQRREAELIESYQRLELLAREQERTLERTRILKDMHDGVGSHITSAIRQLESVGSSRSEILETLRDSLDHLKLSIDAIHLPPGDVAALLANLRYRLDRRFTASDIELRWAVEAIGPVPRLDAAAMKQLQFILFEALSNVLQHARARVLRIEAAQETGGVRVQLADDGVGFTPGSASGKGLLSMQDRAKAIDAELSVTSSAAGTTVELWIGS
jgi:signal transduction histidine kinase